MSTFVDKVKANLQNNWPCSREAINLLFDDIEKTVYINTLTKIAATLIAAHQFDAAQIVVDLSKIELDKLQQELVTGKCTCHTLVGSTDLCNFCEKKNETRHNR